MMDPPNKEKRIKREIANSNERRRMQSINAGFQKLKRLLPVNDGEKISKANILQHAADYIATVERDRVELYDQNTLLRRILNDLKSGKTELAALDTTRFNLTDTLTTSNNATNTTTSIRTSQQTPTPLTPETVAKPATNITSLVTLPTINTPAPTTRRAHKTHRIVKNQKPTRSYTKRNSTSTRNNCTANNITNGSTDDKLSTTDTASDTNNNSSTPNSSSDQVRLSNGVAKAAIALPLEVPYTSEIIIKTSPLASVVPQITTTTNTSTTAIDSKGQSLDTICKAIMEIEGDCVFKKEKHDCH